MKSDSTTVIKNMEFLVKELHKDVYKRQDMRSLLGM